MTVTRNFLLAGTGTLLSRLLGFGRDAAIAWLLGAGIWADALSVALRLPYVARRMLGEGTLSLSLTTASIACGNARLARSVAPKLALWAGLFVCAGLLLAPLLAHALSVPEESLSHTLLLMRLCLPYLLFAALAACAMAGLHALGKFGLPGLAPSLFNIAMLCAAAGAALTGSTPQATTLWFAGGVLVGGFCQWLVLKPSLMRLVRNLPSPPAAHVSAAVRELPAGILAAAVPQLAFALAAIPLLWMQEGSLAALFYAERLLEFPLGLTAASLGMALVPELASSSTEAFETTSRRVSAALGLSLLVNLPATAGLLACADPIVRLLFQHGAFDDNAAQLTTLALQASIPALPAYALARPLLATSQSLGLNNALFRPSWISLAAALFLCTTLGLLLDSPIGPALGAALAIWIQTGLLLRLVLRRLRLRLPMRLAVCSGIGSLVVYYAARAVIEYGQGLSWTPFMLVLAAVPAGIGAYCLCLPPARNEIRLLLARMNHKTMQNIKPSAFH